MHLQKEMVFISVNNILIYSSSSISISDNKQQKMPLTNIKRQPSKLRLQMMFVFCSDENLAVAELLSVCWLEVHGRFELANLSPGRIYEVVFVVMLKDPAYGWEIPVNLRLTLPDGSKQEHKENLMEKPRGKWIEIPAGEIKSSTEKTGEMEFSLYEYEGGKWKKGLLIKGVKIQPKA